MSDLKEARERQLKDDAESKFARTDPSEAMRLIAEGEDTYVACQLRVANERIEALERHVNRLQRMLRVAVESED